MTFGSPVMSKKMSLLPLFGARFRLIPMLGSLVMSAMGKSEEM